MKRQIFSLFLLLLTLVACGDKPLDPNKPVYVKIKTTMGDVTVLLYDDTPLHRDNFIKLCQSNEYEGMLFHRVIKEFVVQGGDPESKAHEPGALYGDGDGGYTVPAEILPNHFNKKGAYGAEIKAGTWHGLLVLESGSVIYEIKQGPFAPLAPENLAPWSPEAEDTEGVKKYLEWLESQI